MILFDTNVLVALVDERDELHAHAVADLSKLKGPYGVLDAVLVETYFLLADSYLRGRIRIALTRLSVTHVQIQAAWWSAVFDSLDKYHQHSPDLCDALLVVAAAREEGLVWSYDQEFRRVWRSPEGRAVRVAGSARKSRRKPSK